MLTDNEKKVIRLLLSSSDIDLSINQISRECGLAPNGALKILKKFEGQGILGKKKIANINSYRIDFSDIKAESIIILSLASELSERLKYRNDDLRELQDITCACVIFGSYAEGKKDANDIDILFVLDKNNYSAYKKKLSKVNVPVKIHDAVQTREDMESNLKKGDKLIKVIIRKGVVLWGHKFLYEVIRSAYKGKD